MKIAIINGPNLNLLGKRETDIYGGMEFGFFLDKLKMDYPSVAFSYHQSNVEGEIINLIHECAAFDGIIMNAAGYTHTSVSIADAIAAVGCPVIEVHISNIFAREDFRHVSFTGAKCIGSISGLGLSSYRLAVEYFVQKGKNS
jgi:3-dehydroquinate dehydratase II